MLKSLKKYLSIRMFIYLSTYNFQKYFTKYLNCNISLQSVYFIMFIIQKELDKWLCDKDFKYVVLM